MTAFRFWRAYNSVPHQLIFCFDLFLTHGIADMDSAKNADHPTERDKNLLRKYGTAITRGNLLHHQLEVRECIKALGAGQDQANSAIIPEKEIF
jgi:hypothetical protein